MPVANIYFVLGCSKPAAMVSRVPKSNVVTSLFFTMKRVIFKKGYWLPSSCFNKNGPLQHSTAGGKLVPGSSSLKTGVVLPTMSTCHHACKEDALARVFEILPSSVYSFPDYTVKAKGWLPLSTSLYAKGGLWLRFL